MHPQEILDAITTHGWVVGPRFTAGWGIGRKPRNGYLIYADWAASHESHYAAEPQDYTIGFGETLEDAVRMALAKAGRDENR